MTFKCAHKKVKQRQMDYSLNQAFGKGQKLVQASRILRNYNTPRKSLQPVDEIEESESKESNGGSQRGDVRQDQFERSPSPLDQQNVERQIELQLADISRSDSVEEE